MSLNARQIALSILNTVGKGRHTLDKIIEDFFRKNSNLSKRDRAFTQALVFGVLRWRRRLDWIINYFSKTPSGRLDPVILNILRLGLFQVVFLDRVPDSAAVNTSVEMAKPCAPKWVVRFVNGLLRNAARKYRDVSFPDSKKDMVEAISISKSFPSWMIKRWLERFGHEETEALCDSINMIPPITIRTNTFKTTRKTLLESFEIMADKVECTGYSQEGISFYHAKSTIDEMAAFKDGLFQVQDEAAQLVSLLLAPRPGEIVLDACAGLGGKTGHIAQLMENHGKIVAMDMNEKKLLKLETEMDRLGFTNVLTVKHDLHKKYEKKQFDRILLDAPCSGMGVLRRNPDTKWSMTLDKIFDCKKRQEAFLDQLAGNLKTGGILVYAVCSMEPEENEQVIKTFLNKHAEFVIETEPKEPTGELRGLINERGCLNTFPHINNMDGFFSVCLKKQ